MSEGSESRRTREEAAAQRKAALKRRKKGSPYYFRGAVRIAPDKEMALQEYIGSRKAGIKEGLPRPLVTGSSASNSYHNLPVPFGYYFVTLLFYPSDNTPVLVTIRHTPSIVNTILEAIKEAIEELAILEMRVATRPSDTVSTGARMEATVIIFSDAKGVLQATKAEKFLKRMKHTGHAIIHFSELLREIPWT
ncbi:hypothetical protein B0T09DRAFT_353859 [Sordaria sp. MPI-SDFR-AT-0083]|nr:hypothetical protein B0T09DRAFT_353859 [Sordaria sp. MPI-SDFR-AT-0083]